MNTTLRSDSKLLVQYLGPQRRRFLFLALLLATTIGLQLVNPQIIRAFLDAAVAGASGSRLMRIALTYVGLAILIQAIGFTATYLSETIAWTATNALRRDLTAHVLDLDMSFHKAHTAGELIERIDGDVTTLAEFFSQMALRLASNGLLALGVVVVLTIEDWRIGLVAIGYAGLIALSTRTVQRAAVAAWGRSRQAHGELSSFLGERLAATEDIRANGGEPYVMSRLYGKMRTVFHAWRTAALVRATSRALGALAFVLTQAVTLAIGIVLYRGGSMTLGTLYLLIHYLARLRGPLVEIRHHIDGLQRARASIERIRALLGESSSLIEAPRAALPPGPLRVRFDDVTFCYDDAHATTDDGARTALEDISFTLEPGRVLGLLGRTGSGKTTLTRLLFRLYDPTTGAIRLGDASPGDARLAEASPGDGASGGARACRQTFRRAGFHTRRKGLQPDCDLVAPCKMGLQTDPRLDDLSLRDLRRRIGLVTQDVQLFRASVRHNVSLFSDRVQDEQILEAFRALGLWSWYRALPDGLDTVLEAGSNSLSAGEAQLLALTRVYLKDPGVVVLDEASSRLDPATEQLLERAIDRLLEGRTAIVIAHRLATVARADEIMVLEGGRIQEHGPREALAADPASRFYRLLRTGLEEVLA